MDNAAPTISPTSTSLTTSNNVECSRIDAHLDGELVGFAAYEICDDGVHSFHHTEIFEGNEGRGLGQLLAAGVMDFAREQGVRIAPTCPFIAGYMRKNPETQDLLDPKFTL